MTDVAQLALCVYCTTYISQSRAFLLHGLLHGREVLEREGGESRLGEVNFSRLGVDDHGDSAAAVAEALQQLGPVREGAVQGAGGATQLQRLGVLSQQPAFGPGNLGLLIIIEFLKSMFFFIAERVQISMETCLNLLAISGTYWGESINIFPLLSP